ncbi:MAG TPA: hypothetical protein VFZ44_00990 [Pyrinomonadaceae bacterium]
MLVYVLIFMVIVSLALFVHKVIYKRRMERTLGRKVSDRELTSLTSWMEPTAEEKAEKRPGQPPGA